MTKPHPERSWLLAMSSPIHRRTVELYREHYPVARTWTDESTWVECYRKAREEFEAKRGQG